MEKLKPTLPVIFTIIGLVITILGITITTTYYITTTIISPISSVKSSVQDLKNSHEISVKKETGDWTLVNTKIDNNFNKLSEGQQSLFVELAETKANVKNLTMLIENLLERKNRNELTNNE